MSKNHQYIEFEDRIIKRYEKTVPSVLTGLRLDPHRPENRIDWLLVSPTSSFKQTWTDGEKPTLDRVAFSYADEVVELYSDVEVRLFERLNKAAIEAGLLIPYEGEAPAINTDNALIDTNVFSVASIKQVTALKKRINDITSIITLNRVLEAAKDLDRPISIIKAIESRINELSSSD